ncbi:MAG: LytTR family transcriptional regulator DNA-binding domain-containing protein [Prevotella sp.]|nr:LytTR family transcriptional regulator DNA-binding domain-containing protein [Prevotella sp.]
MTRIISVTFVVLALAVFKPFGLDAWQWHGYVHLAAIGAMGFSVCMLTDIILKHVVKMPRAYDKGAEYIIRRNLWFQLINTPTVAFAICLYRHFVLSRRVEGNMLSLVNYVETLVIIAFCSFAIGLYWRFKFRSRYLAAELEETRLLNEQLKAMASRTNPSKVSDVEVPDSTSDEPIGNQSSTTCAGDTLTLTGTTNESVTLQLSDLLYIEAVGNYLKVCHLSDGRIRTDMLRTTLKQMEETLSPYPSIVRCHRAFLVNLGQVEQITAKSGTMQLLMKHCNDTIPVSRSNMAGVKESIRNL